MKIDKTINHSLDTIHHIAIQVKNISESVDWYQSNYTCEITYQDDSWAMLKFANTYLALVLPEQHPYHFAILTDDLSPYGDAVPHRDGTASVYIKDKDGNNVEMLTLPEE
ncbi:MAG: VOC family protein [Rickettsiales bacterium]|nr:VOC family protein [Rickettsiales bacterium]